MSSSKTNVKNVNDLFDRIPDELKDARIGFCYNAFTKAIIKRPTFDLGKLNHEKLILRGTPKASFSFRASSNSSATSSKTLFALDSKVKANFGVVKASAGFNMSNAKASAKTFNGIQANVSYLVRDEKIEMIERTPEVYFNCMMPEFQQAYRAIMDAENASDRLKHYQEFVKRFGTACITRVDLIAGSIAEISIAREEHGQSTNNEYGASLSVGFKGNGFSGATQWAGEAQSARSEATVHVDVDIFPFGDNPTQEWVQGIANAFIGIGIKELTKEATYKGLDPQKATIKAPTIPETKPDKKELPKKKDNDEDFGPKLKQSLMEADGFTGTWEEYLAKQQEAIDNLSPVNVIDEIPSIIESSDEPEAHSIQDRVNEEANKTAYNSTLLTSSEISDNPNFDLGGYMPIDFELTSWFELFPDLKAAISSSFSNINIARIYTYYYTRLQFAQYLNFLTGVRAELTLNNKMEDDAGYFWNLCSEFFEKIQAALENGLFSNVQYRNLIRWFETEISEMDDFNSLLVYKNFFKYYDFMEEHAYGYLFQVTPKGEDKQYYFRAMEGYTNHVLAEATSFKSMLVDAVRHYPVIRKDGTLTIVCFNSEGRKQKTFDTYTRATSASNPIQNTIVFYHSLHDFREGTDTLINSISAFEVLATFREDGRIEHTDPKGKKRFRVEGKWRGNEFDKIYFKGIGHAFVDRLAGGDLTNIKIRGKAMWEAFPFGDIKKFLRA